jgi:hypothetical protein
MKLSELKNKITTILRERSTYKLGTQEYTKKNLTPTDILDLAMAYSQVQGKGTTIYGRKMEKMIKVGNDLAKLNGTTQQDAKKRGSKPALILTLLKNKLVTKDEYIKLYKDLLLKQTSVVKALKNADPAGRMVGGAAARAAHRDMKSESVNEILTIVDKFDAKKQDYDKMYYKDGGDRPGDGNLKKAKKELAKLSKKHKGLTLVSVGRNSKMYDVMKADESVVNESYDSKTGLFYLQGVPFTRERMKEIIGMMMKGSSKPNSRQFEYENQVVVKDKSSNKKVVIDSKNLKTLFNFYKKNWSKLASDKDF